MLAKSHLNTVLLFSGAPDRPTDVKVTDIKWNSLKIHWMPGFDGGKPQEFLVLLNGDSKPAFHGTEAEITGN